MKFHDSQDDNTWITKGNCRQLGTFDKSKQRYISGGRFDAVKSILIEFGIETIEAPPHIANCDETHDYRKLESQTKLHEGKLGCLGEGWGVENVHPIWRLLPLALIQKFQVCVGNTRQSYCIVSRTFREVVLVVHFLPWRCPEFNIGCRWFLLFTPQKSGQYVYSEQRLTN